MKHKYLFLISVKHIYGRQALLILFTYTCNVVLWISAMVMLSEHAALD